MPLVALSSAGKDVAPVLEELVKLYLLSTLELNLTQLLTLDVLRLAQVGKLKKSVILPHLLLYVFFVQATRVRPLSCTLCAELLRQSFTLVDSFGIIDAMLSTSIALDRVKCNKYDNQRELRAA